ncbi:MAG: hypothetical protein RIS52_1287, partial [Pseudomonadota bacterium]
MIAQNLITLLPDKALNNLLKENTLCPISKPKLV